MDLEILEENVVKKKKEKLMVVNQSQIVPIKSLMDEFFCLIYPTRGTRLLSTIF